MGKYIFFAVSKVADFFFCSFEAGLKSIGKSACKGLLVAEDKLLKVFAYLAGSLTVFALDISLDFL